MPVNVIPAKTETQPPKLFSFKWATKNNQDMQQVQRNSINLAMRGESAPIDKAPEFKAGIVAKAAAESLAEMWGISSEEEVVGTCQHLLSYDSGHTGLFDFLLGLTRLYRDRVEAGEAEDTVLKTLWDFARQVESARPEFNTELSLSKAFQNWINIYRDPRFQAYAPQAISESASGWDIGRVDNVAGLGVQAGFVTSEQHQQLTGAALDMIKQNFDDWHDYMLSWWWGRAMWCAVDGEPFPEIVGNILSSDDALSHAFYKDKAPWVRFPLHP